MGGTDRDPSRDLFLDGRLAVLQPRKGRHRAGTDAVLLAASVQSEARGTLVDLGAGAGVAGLCAVAVRPALRAVLVEVDPLAADLARRSLDLEENQAFADRVRVVEADLLAREPVRRAAGLEPGMAGHVIMNPPFHEPGTVRASPKAARAFAHVLSDEGLEGWVRTAASLCAPGGRFSAIWPADRLSVLLNAVERRFGSLGVLPLFPADGVPAIRVIVAGIKGSRARTRLMAGMTLHRADGRFTVVAEEAMRTGFFPPSMQLLG